MLPLSGGADSSATAAIVGCMCQLVTKAIDAGDTLVEADAKRYLILVSHIFLIVVLFGIESMFWSVKMSTCAEQGFLGIRNVFWFVRKSICAGQLHRMSRPNRDGHDSKSCLPCVSRASCPEHYG